MIPLHLVMVRINVVFLIILYTIVYVRNVQIPVGIHDNTEGGLWGRKKPAKETLSRNIIIPRFLYRIRTGLE